MIERWIEGEEETREEDNRWKGDERRGKGVREKESEGEGKKAWIKVIMTWYEKEGNESNELWK